MGFEEVLDDLGLEIPRNRSVIPWPSWL